MRFENRLNTDKLYFNVLNPVWDNKEEDALNVFEMIDLLNEYEIEMIRKERYRIELDWLKDEISKELYYLENKAMDNPVNRGRILALKDLMRRLRL